MSTLIDICKNKFEANILNILNNIKKEYKELIKNENNLPAEDSNKEYFTELLNITYEIIQKLRNEKKQDL